MTKEKYEEIEKQLIEDVLDEHEHVADRRIAAETLIDLARHKDFLIEDQ